LPKDLRALLYRAKERDVDSPLLASILESNRRQITRAISMVERTGRKSVGILGLSFKAGTDDVRESSIVPLIETLVGRGFKVSVYDETVELPRLIGANRSYIEETLPHIATLMRSSIDEIMAEAQVLVVANGGSAYGEVAGKLRSGQVLIDLVGVGETSGASRGEYDGICW
jgi:GDP-mannose 6-dehydrogenase